MSTTPESCDPQDHAAGIAQASDELTAQVRNITSGVLDVMAALYRLEERHGEWRMLQLPEHAQSALRDTQRVTTAVAQRLEQQVAALKHAAHVIREAAI